MDGFLANNTTIQSPTSESQNESVEVTERSLNPNTITDSSVFNNIKQEPPTNCTSFESCIVIGRLPSALCHSCLDNLETNVNVHNDGIDPSTKMILYTITH